ncbi:DUF6924 domain-containing protein [Nocardia abscessus]|uniref:DUF6924 domain-containing protein n=1 Tax=Nocardia abscessus TaxID=120957 RepID=UPI0024544623|nr:hypothetical protein [Nocardia abscessus]
MAVTVVAVIVMTVCSGDTRPAAAREENVMLLPDDESLFIRTYFADDAAWAETLEAVLQPWDLGGGILAYAGITPVDDRRFEALTVEQLESLLPAPPPYYLFLVDKRTVTDPEHPILVVDTSRGNADVVGFHTFRVVPSEMPAVENNLSLSNMDFEDFSDSVDADGVFRGF